jgi:tRNA-uridine 2-sulfurtransferase
MNIAVLASGGVDSAVATHLMCEQGHKPTLFYIIIGAKEESEFSCTMEEDLEMVNMLARQYGLKVETVDLHRDYWDNVMEYLVERVRKGLTPNPDVMCNSLVKFGCFYDKVGRDFDMTVTGHYASTVVKDGVKYLATTPDPVKDQTDFLCQITPQQLSALHFPLGNMRKNEVRDIAQRHNLAPARRKDSQGICFLGNTTYNSLLEHYLGTLTGDIVEWETGNVVGQHRGYWFFTPGQRKGIGLGGGPWFVVSKDIDNNVVFVTRHIDNPSQLCNADKFTLSDFHTIATSTLGFTPDNTPISFKIRHSPEFETGTLTYNTTLGKYVIKSDRSIQGVAPGQFAVVYLPYDADRKICLGSGEIASRL